MELTATPRSGLISAYDRFAQSAERVAQSRVDAKVDYAREVVEQISARRQARANVEVIKAFDEMRQRVLDLKV